MYVLAIDSSGHTASVAIVAKTKTEEKLVAEFSLNCGYTHSVTLMPLVDNIFNLTNLELRDMDYIACASGPGSFTGLRIGAAAAKGLAAAAEKRMVNVSALDALAYNVYRRNGLAVPIMDARRSEVYYAVYDFSGGMKRISDYEADKIENVMERAGKSAVFLGDGAVVHRDLLIKNGFDVAPVGHCLQRAASVGALAVQKALNGETISPADFKISYIRKPQAEREQAERELENA